MHETTSGDWHRITFDSFWEYLDYHDEHPAKASFDSWNGASSVGEATALARTGLGAEGLAALNAATELLPSLEGKTVSTEFHSFNSVEGGFVDIGAYLGGEPECMVTFECDPTVEVEPVVTIVIATGILGSVRREEIAKRGARVMAFLQACEMCGVSTEVWSDSTTRGRGDLYGRISTRLKAAGEPFNASMLMYAMTHDSMHRVLGFNTKDHFPSRWSNAMGHRAGYGSTALGDLKRPQDYRDKAVYIPALSHGVEFSVEDALREVGLLRD